MFVLLFALVDLVQRKNHAGDLPVRPCDFRGDISVCLNCWTTIPRKNWRLWKSLGGIFHFLLVLLRVLSRPVSMSSAWFSLPKKEVDPKLVFFYTDLSTDTGRVGLANAITLTPGTITVFCEHELFCVHALDTASQADVDESQFMHLLKKLED